MKQIIHIADPFILQSNKTYDELKNNKNIYVIDTCEIDSKNSSLLLNDPKNNKYFTKKNISYETYFSKLDELNFTTLLNLIRSSNRDIIIVLGIITNMPKFNDVKVIGIYPIYNLSKLHTDYNINLLEIMRKNKKDIDSILQNDKIHSKKKEFILTYKYGLERSFPCNIFTLNTTINNTFKHFKKLKYKTIKMEELFSEIKKIIKQ